MQQVSFPGGESPDEVISALEALVRDLRRLRAGLSPTDDDLRDAPQLDQWRLTRKELPALMGIADRHPVLGWGPRYLRTSQLYALGPKWARTHSRYYILRGEAGPVPHDDEVVGLT